jgi:sulfate adenylyltransferase subunit 1 (EFTu-like GTPase family)
VVIVGHVDHGKSTLVGRLLVNCDAIHQERLAEAASATRAGGGFDPAFVTDQLATERRRRITLDTAQACLRTDHAALVLIDTPGHRELVGNMLSGAGYADAAVLVVDAQRGIEAQTQEHLNVLAVLGVRHVIVAINKIDLVGFVESAYAAVRDQVVGAITDRGGAVLAALPVSALHDHQVSQPSPQLPWYQGPTLLQLLQRLPCLEADDAAPACFVVQDVRVMEGHSVGLGRIASGVMRSGGRYRIWPSGRPVRIDRFLGLPDGVNQAQPGDSLGVMIDDQSLLARGALLVEPDSPLKPVDRVVVEAMQIGGKALKPDEALAVRTSLGLHTAAVQTVSRCGPSGTVSRDDRRNQTA